MAENIISKIPDKRGDIRYAVACVGRDAEPTGRIRVVSETNTLEFEWRGPWGHCWLPVPLVSNKDATRPTILQG